MCHVGSVGVVVLVSVAGLVLSGCCVEFGLEVVLQGWGVAVGG